MISNNKEFCLSKISEGYSFQKCLAIVPPISHDRTRNQLHLHLTISGWNGNFLSKLELAQINQTNANKISSQHYLLSLTIELFPNQPENMSSNEIPFYKQILAVYNMPIKIYCLSRVLVTVHLAHIFTQ